MGEGSFDFSGAGVMDPNPVPVSAWKALDGKLFWAEHECMMHNLGLIEKQRCTSYWIAVRMTEPSDRHIFLYEVFVEPAWQCDESMILLLVEEYCRRSFGRRIIFGPNASLREHWNLERICRGEFLESERDGLLAKRLEIREFETVTPNSANAYRTLKTWGLEAVKP